MAQPTARGLTPKQAAEYLGISEQTLRKQRSTARQPTQGIPKVPFARAGRRIIYLIDDLDRWLDAQRAKASRARRQQAVNGSTER